MSVKSVKEKKYKIFVVPDSPQPKIFSIPSEFRFPTFFVDFPLIRSGIRHLIAKKQDGRYSESSDKRITVAVRNPLSPASLKLLMLLLAQKEQQVYMKVRDVMRIIGDERNAPRDFDRYIQNIQDARLSITFLKEEIIPKELKTFFSSIKLRDGYKKRIRDVVIISSVADLIREERKARDTKINFSQEFIAVCNSAKSGYAKVKTSILEQLSNKHSEELLVYLLCLKMQKKHLRDYLTLYLLNCSQRFLIEKVKKERVDVVRESIRRIFKRSLEALQKLKELNVIKDFSYEEGRLSVGDGGRTVPFFESLTLIKPHSAEKTE